MGFGFGYAEHIEEGRGVGYAPAAPGAIPKDVRISDHMDRVLMEQTYFKER
jgi:hypothetical protein